MTLGSIRLRYRDWTDRPLVLRAARVITTLTGRSLQEWRRTSRRRDVADAVITLAFGLVSTFASAIMLFDWHPLA